MNIELQRTSHNWCSNLRVFAVMLPLRGLRLRQRMATCFVALGFLSRRSAATTSELFLQESPNSQNYFWNSSESGSSMHV
eukprot:1812169-Amphidinium_carterae.1